MTRGRLNFIHVGKCGGSTLVRILPKSPVASRQYSELAHTHVRAPSYDPDDHYIISLRNPVGRAISAFNWRYKLVVTEEKQKSRFNGEWDALAQYGSLNELALALYRDDRLCEVAAAQFRTIHHLKEDIAYYLAPLLGSIRPEQVFAVLLQETLNQDIREFLGVANNLYFRRNEDGIDPSCKRLSVQAFTNLKRFLADDYRCISALQAFGALSDDRAAQLLADESKFLRTKE